MYYVHSRNGCIKKHSVLDFSIAPVKIHTPRQKIVTLGSVPEIEFERTERTGYGGTAWCAIGLEGRAAHSRTAREKVPQSPAMQYTGQGTHARSRAGVLRFGTEASWIRHFRLLV